MLTNDKKITEVSYWDRIYKGENNDAHLDASNNVRPKNTFDRFGWIAQHAEGWRILDIGSGHAHSCKRIKAIHPDWLVVASDQSVEAKKAANYLPYEIFKAYSIPYPDKTFDTVMISQALEYLEFPDVFLKEAGRVGKKFLCTVPEGLMDKWSQLRLYTEESLKEFLTKYGEIEVFEKQPGLMLAKIKFYD